MPTSVRRTWLSEKALQDQRSSSTFPYAWFLLLSQSASHLSLCHHVYLMSRVPDAQRLRSAAAKRRAEARFKAVRRIGRLGVISRNQFAVTPTASGRGIPKARLVSPLVSRQAHEGSSAMDEYESLSHTKWECKYHVVFIPKYRRKALYGELRGIWEMSSGSWRRRRRAGSRRGI